MEEEIRNFIESYSLAWKDNWGFVAPTEAEVSEYLFQLKSAAGTGIPTTEFDPRAVRDKLQVEKYLSSLLGGLSVADADVTAYYDGHKSEFLQTERLQVSQILCPTEREATDVLGGLANATEAKFREAVKASSKGVEAAKGGLLGIFSAGQLPAELERVVFALKPGQISRVVESTYGYHIFRLDRKFEPKLQTLIEARPAIMAKLLDEQGKAAVAAHIEELKAALDWKAETDKLPFIYQRNET
jgi:parvulin-like peptidyl-prolyl isomerase